MKPVLGFFEPFYVPGFGWTSVGRILLFTFFCLAPYASAATIVHPKLPEVNSAWVYVDVSSLQKEDIIIYLSDNQKDSPPWFMALVFNVDQKDGSIIVERPIGRGSAVFEEVDRKRIISAARAAKDHALLMPTHPPFH